MKRREILAVEAEKKQRISAAGLKIARAERLLVTVNLPLCLITMQEAATIAIPVSQSGSGHIGQILKCCARKLHDIGTAIGDQSEALVEESGVMVVVMYRGSQVLTLPERL